MDNDELNEVSMILQETRISVPPINLINVDTINYLFTYFPYLINLNQESDGLKDCS